MFVGEHLVERKIKDSETGDRCWNTFERRQEEVGSRGQEKTQSWEKVKLPHRGGCVHVSWLEYTGVEGGREETTYLFIYVVLPAFSSIHLFTCPSSHPSIHLSNVLFFLSWSF